MKEMVVFSDEQKAVIKDICNQFEDNLASNYFEYSPVKAYRNFVKSGDFAKYTLEFKKIFAVLEELSAMEGIGIQIDILENTVDPKNNCVTDSVKGSVCLTENSTEEDQMAFDLRMHFGSVYILTTAKNIIQLRAFCTEYIAKIKFDDYGNFSVDIYDDNVLYRSFDYPHFHDGSRPQLVTKHILEPVRVGKKITKEMLNRMLKKNNAPQIRAEESIASSIYGRNTAAAAILPLFLEFKPDWMRNNGNVSRPITALDVALFEKHATKH